MFGIGNELEILVNGMQSHGAHPELVEWARVEGVAASVQDPERHLGETHEPSLLALPLARLQELLRRHDRAA